jgi:hypothetical protein
MHKPNLKPLKCKKGHIFHVLYMQVYCISIKELTPTDNSLNGIADNGDLCYTCNP